MTREEALKRAKPMLFNTPMMLQNLNGTKCVTRRLADKTTERLLSLRDYSDRFTSDQQRIWLDDGATAIPYTSLAKYHVGDILYARETFMVKDGKVIYRAGCTDFIGGVKWKPAIHMPKEYTRYFAVIEKVELERICSVNPINLINEGIDPVLCAVCERAAGCPTMALHGGCMVANMFRDIFNETVDKNDKKHRYEANPWVFAYHYRQLEVESEGKE